MVFMAKIDLSGFIKTANGIVPVKSDGSRVGAKALLQSGNLTYDKQVGTLSLLKTDSGNSVYYNGIILDKLYKDTTSISITSNGKGKGKGKKAGKIKVTNAPYLLVRVHKVKNDKGIIRDYKYILKEKSSGKEQELLRENVEKFFVNPKWDGQDRSKRLLGGSGALVDGLIENYYSKDDTWHLRVNKNAETVLDDTKVVAGQKAPDKPDTYTLTDVWARTVVAGAGKHKLEKYAYRLVNDRTQEDDVYTRDQMMNLFLNRTGTGEDLYDSDRLTNASIQYYKNTKGSESWRIRVQESKVNWHVDEVGHTFVNAVLYMCSKVYCVKVPNKRGGTTNQYVEFEVVPLAESDVEGLKDGTYTVDELFSSYAMTLTGADLVALTEKADTIAYPFYDSSKIDNLKVKNKKGKTEWERLAEIEVYKEGKMPASSITQYYPEIVELDYETWRKSHQEHVEKIEQFIKEKEDRAVNTVITWDEVVKQPLSDDEMNIKGITFEDLWNNRLKKICRVSTLPLETDEVTKVSVMYDITATEDGNTFMVKEVRTEGSMRSSSARKFVLEGEEPSCGVDELGHHWVRFLSCICNALDKRLIFALGTINKTKYVVTCADVVTQKKALGDKNIYYLPLYWTEKFSVKVHAKNEADAINLANAKLITSINHPVKREIVGSVKLDEDMKVKLINKKETQKKPDDGWFKTFGAEDVKESKVLSDEMSVDIPGDVFKEGDSVVLKQRVTEVRPLNVYLVEATIDMCGYIAVEAKTDEEAYTVKAAEVLDSFDKSKVIHKYVAGTFEIQSCSLIEGTEESEAADVSGADNNDVSQAWDSLDAEAVNLEGYTPDKNTEAVYYVPLTWNEDFKIKIYASEKDKAIDIADDYLISSLNHPNTRKVLGDRKLDKKMKSKMSARRETTKEPDDEWFREFGAEVDFAESKEVLQGNFNLNPAEMIEDNGEQVLEQIAQNMPRENLNTYVAHVIIEMCGYVAVTASSEEEAYGVKLNEVLTNSDGLDFHDKYVLGSYTLNDVSYLRSGIINKEAMKTISGISIPELEDLVARTDRIQINNLLDDSEVIQVADGRTITVEDFISLEPGLRKRLGDLRGAFYPGKINAYDYKLIQDVMRSRPSLIINTKNSLRLENDKSSFESFLEDFENCKIEESFSGSYMEYKLNKDSFNLVYHQEIVDGDWRKSEGKVGSISIDTPGKDLVNYSLGDSLYGLYNRLFTDDSEYMNAVNHTITYFRQFIDSKLVDYVQQVRARDVNYKSPKGMLALKKAAGEYHLFYDITNGKERVNDNLVMINVNGMTFTSFMNTIEFKKGFNTIRAIRPDNQYVWKGLDAITKALGVDFDTIEDAVIADDYPDEIYGPSRNEISDSRRDEILSMIKKTHAVYLGDIFNCKTGTVELTGGTVPKREVVMALQFYGNSLYDKYEGYFDKLKSDVERLKAIASIYSIDNSLFDILRGYTKEAVGYKNALNYKNRTYYSLNYPEFEFIQEVDKIKCNVEAGTMEYTFTGDFVEPDNNYVQDVLTDLTDCLKGDDYRIRESADVLLSALRYFMDTKLEQFKGQDVEVQSRMPDVSVEANGWKLFMYPNAIKDIFVAVNLNVFDFDDVKQVDFDKMTTDCTITAIGDYTNNHVIKGLSNFIDYCKLNGIAVQYTENNSVEAKKEDREVITTSFNLFKRTNTAISEKDLTVEELYARSGHTYAEVLQLKDYTKFAQIGDKYGVTCSEGTEHTLLHTVWDENDNRLEASIKVNNGVAPTCLDINYTGDETGLATGLVHIVDVFNKYLSEAASVDVEVKSTIKKEMFDVNTPVSFCVGAEERFKVEHSLPDDLVPYVKPYADFMLKAYGGYAGLNLRLENLGNKTLGETDIQDIVNNSSLVLKYFNEPDYKVTVGDGLICIRQDVNIDKGRTNKNLVLELKLMDSGTYRMTIAIDDMRWLKSRNIVEPWVKFDIYVSEKLFVMLKELYQDDTEDSVDWGTVDELLDESIDENRLKKYDELINYFMKIFGPVMLKNKHLALSTYDLMFKRRLVFEPHGDVKGCADKEAYKALKDYFNENTCVVQSEVIEVLNSLDTQSTLVDAIIASENPIRYIASLIDEYGASVMEPGKTIEDLDKEQEQKAQDTKLNSLLMDFRQIFGPVILKKSGFELGAYELDVIKRLVFKDSSDNVVYSDDKAYEFMKQFFADNPCQVQEDVEYILHHLEDKVTLSEAILNSDTAITNIKSLIDKYGQEIMETAGTKDNYANEDVQVAQDKKYQELVNDFMQIFGPVILKKQKLRLNVHEITQNRRLVFDSTGDITGCSDRDAYIILRDYFTENPCQVQSDIMSILDNLDNQLTFTLAILNSEGSLKRIQEYIKQYGSDIMETSINNEDLAMDNSQADLADVLGLDFGGDSSDNSDGSDDELMDLFNSLDTVDTSSVSENVSYSDDDWEDAIDLGELEDLSDEDEEQMQEATLDTLISDFIAIFGPILLSENNWYLDVHKMKGAGKKEFAFSEGSAGAKHTDKEAYQMVREFFAKHPYKVQVGFNLILDNLENNESFSDGIMASAQVIKELTDMKEQYGVDYVNKSFKGNSGTQAVVDDTAITQALKEMGIDKSKFGFLTGVNRV